MADRIRRSPQRFCDTNPNAAECTIFPETVVGGPTIIAPDGIAEATQLPTYVGSASAEFGETTATIGTNADSAVWTSFHMSTPTEASSTAIVQTTALATAAVATDPPNVQASTENNGRGGVSKGAVAGIAIGTCVAGAAIAFIVAWLLLKRRDRKFVQKTCPSGYPIYADSSPELVMVQKSAAEGSPYVQVAQTQMRTPVPIPARVPAPAPQQSPSDSLAGVLPPAASDQDVRTRVSALFGQVHRHIDTYYRDVHASITPSMDSDLASFGKDVDLVELLQNCSNPTLVLKHALVAFVLGATGSMDEGNEHTVWPDELSRALSISQNSPSTDSTQVATAQTLHRRLTTYLYTLNHSLAPNNRSQSRLSNLSALSLTRKTSSAVREAAEHFSLAFFPWANPNFGDQERESDLAGIIGEALECRVWLCSQAGEWDFESEAAGRGAVVVNPALVVRELGGPRRVVMEQGVVGV